MKYLWYSLQTIFLLVLLCVIGLFVAPHVPFENTIELRIVESGSMEPAISTGSLVIVRPVPSYGIGDVITFTSQFSDVPTTHRVTDVYEDGGATWFVTKGDANEERDVNPVAATAVLGQVIADVPRAGFVLDFARQPLGFMLLIVLPAILIILSEVEKIWLELKSRRKRDGSGKDIEEAISVEPVRDVATNNPSRSTLMMDVGMPVRFYEQLHSADIRRGELSTLKSQPNVSNNYLLAGSVAVVIALLVASSSFIGSTVSYYNDLEVSIDNFLQAITLDVIVESDTTLIQFIGTDPDGSNLAEVVAAQTADSVSPIYDVSVSVVGTQTVLCNQLQVAVGAPLSYSGPLLGLSASDVTLVDPQILEFTLTNDSGIVTGEVCQVDVVLLAAAGENEGDGGYLDEERVSLTFTYQAPPAPASFLAPAAASFQRVIQQSALAPAPPVTNGTAGTPPAADVDLPDEPGPPDAPENPTQEKLPAEPVIEEEIATPPPSEEIIEEPAGETAEEGVPPEEEEPDEQLLPESQETLVESEEGEV